MFDHHSADCPIDRPPTNRRSTNHRPLIGRAAFKAALGRPLLFTSTAYCLVTRNCHVQVPWIPNSPFESWHRMDAQPCRGGQHRCIVCGTASSAGNGVDYYTVNNIHNSYLRYPTRKIHAQMMYGAHDVSRPVHSVL